MRRHYHGLRLRSLLLFLLVLPSLLSHTNNGSFVAVATAWEWADFTGGGRRPPPQDDHDAWSPLAWFDSWMDDVTETSTLSWEEVSSMRVRDLKRRLARTHGYSAEELGRILDKKELIHALAFEEEKIRLQQVDHQKRVYVQRGIIMAFVAVIAVILWPVVERAGRAIHTMLWVYYDRKHLEWDKCFELESPAALGGVIILTLLDAVQLWVSLSVLASWMRWVIPSATARAHFQQWAARYSFPIPQLTMPVMGGLNLGSMLVSWLLRVVHGRVERWTAERWQKQLQRLRKQRAKQSSQKQNTTATTTASSEQQPSYSNNKSSYSSTPSAPPPSTGFSSEMYPGASAQQQRVQPPPPPMGFPGTNSVRQPVVETAAHYAFLQELHQHPPNNVDDDGDDDWDNIDPDDGSDNNKHENDEEWKWEDEVVPEDGTGNHGAAFRHPLEDETAAINQLD